MPFVTIKIGRQLAFSQSASASADQDIQPLPDGHVGSLGRLHSGSRALGHVQLVLHALLDQCDVVGCCYLPPSPRPRGRLQDPLV